MVAAKKHVPIVKKRTSTPTSKQRLHCTKHQPLQPPPERPLQVPGTQLEEAQGYRQCRETAIQGSGAHAQDRLRVQQEDSPPDALRPQGLPRPQRPRRGHAPHAQPHLCRRDLPRSFIKEAGRNHCAREAAECQGHVTLPSPPLSRDLYNSRTVFLHASQEQEPLPGNDSSRLRVGSDFVARTLCPHGTRAKFRGGVRTRNHAQMLIGRCWGNGAARAQSPIKLHRFHCVPSRRWFTRSAKDDSTSRSSSVASHSHSEPGNSPVPGVYKCVKGSTWYLVATHDPSTGKETKLAERRKVVYSKLLHRWMFADDVERRTVWGKMPQTVVTTRTATGTSTVVQKASDKPVGFFQLGDGVTWINHLDADGVFITSGGHQRCCLVDREKGEFRPMLKGDDPSYRASRRSTPRSGLSRSSSSYRTSGTTTMKEDGPGRDGSQVDPRKLRSELQKLEPVGAVQPVKEDRKEEEKANAHLQATATGRALLYGSARLHLLVIGLEKIGSQLCLLLYQPSQRGAHLWSHSVFARLSALTQHVDVNEFTYCLHFVTALLEYGRLICHTALTELLDAHTHIQHRRKCYRRKVVAMRVHSRSSCGLSKLLVPCYPPARAFKGVNFAVKMDRPGLQCRSKPRLPTSPGLYTLGISKLRPVKKVTSSIGCASRTARHFSPQPAPASSANPNYFPRETHTPELPPPPDVAVTPSDPWPRPYYLEGGLRRVQPYHFTYNTYCKERWRGKPLIDIFASEFRDRPLAYYRTAIEKGNVVVNGKPVPSLQYAVRNGEMISHTLHRHEPPVTAAPIGIVHEDDDIIVINKPAGVPVHPAGRYNYNSLVEIMRAERGHGFNPMPCNRLDRLTSGVMFIGKHRRAAEKLTDQIMARTVKKEYVARVKGEFPAGEVVCEQPILSISPKLGLNRVRANGKEARTVFRRLAYYPPRANSKGVNDQDSEGKPWEKKEGYSIVRCLPLTGRTHQLRVHLQFLGHPITNDPIYCNQRVFGQSLARGETEADNDEDIIARLSKMGKEEVADAVAYHDEMVEDYEKRKAEKMTGELCEVCDTPLYSDPGIHELGIYLHAKRYADAGGAWSYETPLPDWALPPPGYDGPTEATPESDSLAVDVDKLNLSEASAPPPSQEPHTVTAPT
ncbi:hypothetical protein FH972_024556 [Carpinus fangiana]|uniref:Pseudouridine synthase RsuA/RluA-like domain-containing protein n=1 Tax=Carpinus fangiana TaxID=176857 RepID=A0A5N6KYV6_9ROSI|nr:hypothetical protein FH972_024556 [Carpinus fangiana]